ncbi:MAG: hypothetical protein Kow0063_18700 [Anaerolineae bacterium]
MGSRVRSQPKAAVFIDAENHADLQVSALLRQLGRFDVVERHAYADWRNRGLDRLSERLSYAGFHLHHTWSGCNPGAHKDTADGHMAQGIWQVVSRRPEIAVIVIVSGDGYFTHITRELRRLGKSVIVAADSGRANHALRGLASQYLPC